MSLRDFSNRYEIHRAKRKKSKSILQRVALVFLCSVITFTMMMPGEVMALGLFENNGPKQPSTLKAEKVDTTKQQAAFDSPTGPAMTSKKEDRTIDREDTSKRTAHSSTYVNKDGTKTYKYSVRQKNYRNGNKWEKIDNRLSSVTEKTLDPTLWQTITNTIPAPKPTGEFTGKAGLMGVRMMPLSKGVQMSVGGKDVTMKPVGSAAVRPEKKNDSTTTYKNAWKGVDLEYQTEGELVKENIVIKQKDVATEYEFKLTGAKLIDDPKNPGYFTIEGAQDGYRFGGLTLALHDRGPIQIPAQSIKQERTGNNSIKVSLDRSWLESLPASSFPMVIDPSFGRWDADATDWMFKSDGYSCQGNSCWIQAGTLNDNGWKHWRSYIHIPYPELAGKKVLGANIHAYYNPYANPDPNQRYLFFGHANCIGWECRGKHLATVLTAGDFDVNVTDELQLAVNAGDMGAVWSFWGEEVPYKTFKTYSDMSLSVVYDTPTPMATPVEPADKQVTVSTQPTLRVNGVGDADGDHVKYYYRVSTSSDAETGAVINSGWITNTQWTIPDGILQDGTTYYWHVYTQGATQTDPNWVRSFKVDLRTGKDSTQAYDTVGPIGMDLATGNATTSTGTHTMSALGGTIGLNFDYNTPTKSKMGLIGEYWNVSSSHNFASGPPAGAPAMTRHDQDINFTWLASSGPGPGVNTDWFYARWKGYFVAPTTGSYQFGASQDDSADINVNGQSFSGCYGATPCYNGTPITLQAGQVVPITVSYEEATWDGYFRMYVKGAVSERIVPQEWLRTEVQPSAAQYGLAGRYYTDDGSHNFPANSADPNRFMMARNDSKLSFNWGSGGPAPGLQADNFMTRWTGYITVPTSGSYTFGATTDDGIRIKLNNGLLGAQQTVLDAWQPQATTVWGGATNLTAGQQVPITVDYFEQGGGAELNLKVKVPGSTADQEMPVKWLTPKATALPDAWRLGVDVDGNVGYERLRNAGQNVVLEDSTRATHEYTWTGLPGATTGGYKPPVNEDGQLSRNANNTYTLLDTDGRTYIFDAEGKLTSLTTPTDDRSPASLKYEYSGDPSRLMKITDGVTSSRYGTLHYKGVNEEGNCSVPGGFDNAPDGMLCAFKTSDGDVTKLYYKAGQLSRVEKPGNELIDYGYDSLGRIISTRDSLANDAIAASVRTDDSAVLTEVTYDQLGRANAIKAPAPTNNASRVNHTFEYQTAATQMHITGAPEPNGFSKRVEYDSLLRTTKEVDVANLATQTEWDSVKDLELSKTDATGLKSTTIYDQLDRPTDSYGPAPASWYGTDRRPLAGNAAQVPHTQSGYDEGISGLAINVFNNTKLTGAPKLYTTGMDQTAEPAYTLNLTNPTIVPTDGLSMRATGKIRLDQVGTYAFRLYNGGGARLYIDGQLKVDNWTAGNERFSGEGTYVNDTPGKLVSITVEAYKTGTSGSGANGQIAAVLQQRAPGQSVITGNNVANQLTPAYNLTTSQTAFDAAVGNVTTKTNYSNPAYGTVSSTVLDPTGLNLQSSATYETPGSGFLRQTSKTLPGGGTTSYQHYSASDTRDNPCTTETEFIHQGGRPKGKVEADPDGVGPLNPRTSETIYNVSGEVVATRYNDETWMCTSYDNRGRTVKTVIPTIGDKPGRTIINNYMVDGSPLKTSTGDDKGVITTEIDLLGRTIGYTDANNKVTNSTYDDLGRLTARNGPLGVEGFVYDSVDRLLEQKLDNTVIAIPHYDQYGRLASVDYPTAGQQRLGSITRDESGRTIGYSYVLGDGSTVSDVVTRSSSGQVLTNSRIIGSDTLNSTYTYDKATRLTAVTIGNSIYAYEFGDTDISCGTGSGVNPNASKNSNRTKQTINGVVTTYCYDYADRLISSSDPLVNTLEYDSHGNTTRVGTTNASLRLSYDNSDRNSSLEELDNNLSGKGAYYQRDVYDRIIERKAETITESAHQITSHVRYGFTSASDTPDLLIDMNGNVKEKYIGLAGGTLLTLRSDEAAEANRATHSLPNVHGDIFVTTDKNGAATGNFDYDPFGNPLYLTSNPQNTESGSFDWVGRARKQTENDFSLRITQMGVRVYVPRLGRFLQVDPVEGGTLNNYIYAADPVNQYDLNGKWVVSLFKAIGNAFKSVLKQTPKQVTKSPVSKTTPRVAPRSSIAPTPKQVIAKTPPQAQKVVKGILETGKSPYRMKPFQNRELKLPSFNPETMRRVQYLEHDIRKVVDPAKRGVERIVSGDDGSIWYTADHYMSFLRLK